MQVRRISTGTIKGIQTIYFNKMFFEVTQEQVMLVGAGTSSKTELHKTAEGCCKNNQERWIITFV